MVKVIIAIHPDNDELPHPSFAPPHSTHPIILFLIIILIINLDKYLHPRDTKMHKF